MYKNRENIYQLKNIFLTLNDITNLETKNTKSIKNDKSRSQGKRLGKNQFFLQEIKSLLLCGDRKSFCAWISDTTQGQKQGFMHQNRRIIHSNIYYSGSRC